MSVVMTVHIPVSGAGTATLPLQIRGSGSLLAWAAAFSANFPGSSARIAFSIRVVWFRSCWRAAARYATTSVRSRTLAAQKLSRPVRMGGPSSAIHLLNSVCRFASTFHACTYENPA